MTGTTAFGATNQSIVLNGTIEATGGTGTVNFSGITGTGTLEANGATLLVTGGLRQFHPPSRSSRIRQLPYSRRVARYFLDKPFPSNSSVRLGSFRIETRSRTSSSMPSGSTPAAPRRSRQTSSTWRAELSRSKVAAPVLTATGTVALSNGDTLNLSGITGFGANRLGSPNSIRW